MFQNMRLTRGSVMTNSGLQGWPGLEDYRGREMCCEEKPTERSTSEFIVLKASNYIQSGLASGCFSERWGCIYSVKPWNCWKSMWNSSKSGINGGEISSLGLQSKNGNTARISWELMVWNVNLVHGVIADKNLCLERELWISEFEMEKVCLELQSVKMVS
jgi:hypothetical protein